MSCGTPKTVFNSSDLERLQAVFDEVCMALLSQSGQMNKGTKAAIRRRLFLLATNGMNDPNKLRDHLLTSATRTSRLRASTGLTIL
jgi:hypothetical protein